MRTNDTLTGKVRVRHVYEKKEKGVSYSGNLTKVKPLLCRMQSFVLRKMTSWHSAGRKKVCCEFSWATMKKIELIWRDVPERV